LQVKPTKKLKALRKKFYAQCTHEILILMSISLFASQNFYTMSYKQLVWKWCCIYSHTHYFIQ